MGEDEEDFDSSPRPVKKRRLVGTPKAVVNAKKQAPAPFKRVSKARKQKDDEIDDFIVPDDDDDSPPVVKRKPGRPKKAVIRDSDDEGSIISDLPFIARKGRGKSKQPADTSNGDKPTPVKKAPARKRKSKSATLDSDEDGSTIPATSKGKGKGKNQSVFDDFDEDGFAKPAKPKHSIHIPSHDNLKDIYLDADSTAPPPSTNPWEIRGAIWKKDTATIKSVFDIVPVPTPKPSPVPVRQTPPVPSFNAAPPVQNHVPSPLPVIQVRPSLAKFMAPPRATAAASAPVVQQPDADIPGSDDLDEEDWAQLNDAHAKPPVINHGTRAGAMLPPPSRKSDVPDDDDSDAEDWAQFDEASVEIPERKSVTPHSVDPKTRPSVAPPSLTKVPLPVGKQVSPAIPPSHPEPVEESIMIDDIESDEWDALESANTSALSAKAAPSKPSSLDKHSRRAGIGVVRDINTPVQKHRSPIAQSSKTAQAQDPGPFIELDDEMSEEDEPLPPVQLSDDKPAAKTSTLASLSRSKPAQRQPLERQPSIADELADLPSDAFDDSDDSSTEKNPSDDVVYVSSQRPSVPARKPNTVVPKNSLVQTTLYGGKAPPQKVVSATKKHAWPLATQKEVVTHHKLDLEATNTWVYPTNLGTIRDYQYNIVARGLFHNLLVALPTGLGKTFIAATIMLNWFRWAPESQIVFVAPTKPLVAQQIDACFNIVGIPRSQTVMLTGEVKPAIRAEEWKEKRVFFMTPQTIINDLKHGYCDPKRIVLVVVDEAHRATGGYAYCEVIKFIRRFNQSFRVLALTATPGATVEAVQQVVDGLDISRVEIRTEMSLDIRQYVHAREIDTMQFDLSGEQDLIMELLSKAIQPVLTKLNGQNVYWLKDPMKLTNYGCIMAQKQWQASDAGKKAPQSIKGMVASIFPTLGSLGHGISLLKFHGIGSFYRAMVNFRNQVDSGESRGKYAIQIRQDENFEKMMNTVSAWMRNPDFLGHPKLEYLRSVVSTLR